MHQILILFAHPSIHHSEINWVMREKVKNMENVELRDLYELYPEFYIDVEEEKKALDKADLIIFHHPFYWYSSPPMIKLWQDVVLEKGFAYGPGGNALAKKDFLQVLSTAGRHDAYSPIGKNFFTMQELLRPFEAMCNLCGMIYHPPFVIHNGFNQTVETCAGHAETYRQLLQNYIQQGNAIFNDSKEYTFFTD